MREGWREVALSDVAEIVMGQAPPGDTYNTDKTGTPFIQGCAEFGERHPAPVKWCSAASAKQAHTDDVLLSVRAPVGRINRAASELIIGRGVAAIRARHEALTDYLEAALAFQEPQLQAVSAGSTFTAVTKRDVESLRIPLPPIPEQRRITHLLEAVDEVKARVIEAEAAARALLNALIEDAFVLDNASTVALETVADVRSGIAKGRKSKRPTSPQPYLRAANVQDGWLDLTEIREIEVTDDELDRFRLQTGDVLMVEGSGQPNRLGTGWVWDEQAPGCLHQNHVFRARPSARLAPMYLAYYIQSSAGRRYFAGCVKTSSGLHTINSTQVRGLPVPLPPMDVQETTVARLDAARASLVRAGEATRSVRTFRQQVVRTLLGGKHAIPSSYDRLLTDENAAEAGLEPATV